METPPKFILTFERQSGNFAIFSFLSAYDNYNAAFLDINYAQRPDLIKEKEEITDTLLYRFRQKFGDKYEIIDNPQTQGQEIFCVIQKTKGIGGF